MLLEVGGQRRKHSGDCRMPTAEGKRNYWSNHWYAGLTLLIPMQMLKVPVLCFIALQYLVCRNPGLALPLIVQYHKSK